jgi:hypothetical protein
MKVVKKLIISVYSDDIIWEGGETVKLIPMMSEGIIRTRKLTDEINNKPIYLYFLEDFIKNSLTIES